MATKASIVRDVLGAGWPVSNTAALALGYGLPEPRADGSGSDELYVGKPVANTWRDHLAAQLGSVPRLLMALFCWYLMPDIAALKTLSVSWILPIVARDLAVTIAVAGLWDFLLYSQWSPLRAKAHPAKFNPKYPSFVQIKHDIAWSLCSTLLSSAWEIAVLHAWARGYIALSLPATWWLDWATWAWLLTTIYWRLAHFYWMHRAMHKWNTKRIPDVGAWLYRHVHSLHHKSKNPTSWSGISMHPVESALYYTAALIPVCFGACPLTFWFCKMDLTVGALIGHDGFGFPATVRLVGWKAVDNFWRNQPCICQRGGHALRLVVLFFPPRLQGSHNHWLHHALVQCNFGEPIAPLDWLFGTFAASEADFARKFGPAPSPEAFHAGDEAAAFEDPLPTKPSPAAGSVPSSAASSGKARSTGRRKQA